MNASFQGQVALVTGAAMGMGLATARAFAEAGAAVALADRDEKAVRAATESLVSAGYKAVAITCDVAIEPQVAAMVETTVAAFGRLDAAYNNAGVQSPVAETARAEEVAAAVLWLCSPEASFIIGHGLPVDGGYTVQ